MAGYLLSPLTIWCVLLLVALACIALRRPRTAAAIAVAASLGLWAASLPGFASVLIGNLEARFPAVPVDATPSGDVILILGGALAGASPPTRPSFQLGPAADRVWHAAALYRAGKAPLVAVAAGGQPSDGGEQIEADAIAQMLEILGVPAAAIVKETRSRNTRENARNIRLALVGYQVRRVLLVTSAQHMPRAVRTFGREWGVDGPRIVPCSTDVQVVNAGSTIWDWCFPSAGALVATTKALKEYAGLLAVDII